MTITTDNPTVKVKYTCSCPNCGTVNIEQEREMPLKDFNSLSATFPKDYWKEDGSGKTVYRMHEEDSSARCRRSC